MISTTPKGQAPIRKPYTLDNKQPNAKANVKRRWRPSSEYIAIMKVSARTPNTVIAFIQTCLHSPFAPPACPEYAQLLSVALRCARLQGFVGFTPDPPDQSQTS